MDNQHIGHGCPDDPTWDAEGFTFFGRIHFQATITLQGGARRIQHHWTEGEAEATEQAWADAHQLDLDVASITVREA